MVSYPSVGQIIEVTVETDNPPEIICHTTTEGESDDGSDRVHAILSRGVSVRDQPTHHRSELQRSDRHDGTIQIFGDRHDAIAYFLNILQIRFPHSEDDAYALLTEAGVDMVEYEQWRGQFAKDERVERLIADAKERVDTRQSPHDYAILTETIPDNESSYEPSLRSTSPSDEAVQFGRDLLDCATPTHSCYLRVYEAIQQSDRDDIAYCEGLAMGKHPARASTHAWVEIEDEVIELTWP